MNNDNKVDETEFYKKLLNNLKDNKGISERNVEIITYHLEDYIERANKGRFWFKATNIIVILITGIIPFITLFSWNYVKYLVAFLSATSSITVAISYLNSYKLSWQRYRGYAEEIKSIIRRYSNIGDSTEHRFMNEIYLVISEDIEKFNNHINNKNDIPQEVQGNNETNRDENQSE